MAETKAKSALTKAANRLQKAIDGRRGADFINTMALKLEEAWEDYETECVEDEAFETYQLKYQTAVDSHKNYLETKENDQQKLLIAAAKEMSNLHVVEDKEDVKPNGDDVRKIENVEQYRKDLHVKLPPAPQPDQFSGEKPELFPLWEASFLALIDSHNLGPAEKMYYLKKYLTGEAYSAIESLFLFPCKDSYQSAWVILRERFGDSAKVTAALRRKVETWPKISSPRELRQFSDFLRQLVAAQRKYSGLQILDDSFENQKLVDKLPQNISVKWVEKVVASTDFPKFEIFSNFVKTWADILNHNLIETSANKVAKGVFGGGAANVCHVTLDSKRNQVGVGGAGSGGQSKPCVVCLNPDHRAPRCPKLSELPISERKKKFMELNLCFGCVGQGHQSKECRTRHTCGVCKGRHPTVLHFDSVNVSNVTHSDTLNLNDNVEVLDEVNSPSIDSDINLTQATVLSNDDPNVVMCGNIENDEFIKNVTMFVPVVLENEGVRVSTIAMLDSQSNTNFIVDSVASELRLECHNTHLDLTTMWGRDSRPAQIVTSLDVKGVESSDEVIKLRRCFVTNAIPHNVSSVPTCHTVNYPHLKHIKLPDMTNLKVGLLIGYACAPANRPISGSLCVGNESEPWAWRTKLGWMISGPDRKCKPVESRSFTHLTQAQSNLAPRNLFKEVMINEESDKMSQDDLSFLRIMETKMKQREDGRYEAPLPLKNEKMKFPNNKAVAVKRLDSLKRKFEKDPGYAEKYRKVMEELISLKFAVKLTEEEVQNPPVGRTWYYPHHGVIEGSKIRVVKDAASRFKGQSLNEALLKGPDMLNKLIGILMRFRLEPVAFLCDITKMYLNFRVSDEYTDLQRFLWWPGGDTTQPLQEYKMVAHVFGAKSSSSVATYGIRKIAEDHGRKHGAAAAEFIVRNFYVDDGGTSTPDDDSAVQLFRSTQSLLKEGRCTVHKVVTNSEQLRAKLRDDELKSKPPPGETYKAFGLGWDTGKDLLYVNLSIESVKRTRRGILSATHTPFDPPGMAAPIILQGKIILQELCRRGATWDEALPEDLETSLNKWIRLLNTTHVSVPRCYLESVEFIVERVEIHYFADASSVAYAACAYLRYIGEEEDQYSVKFVQGKCRVLPIKAKMTIPRAELAAAVTASRLSANLKTELIPDLKWPVNEVFWSDSKIVLGQIKNSQKKFEMYILNRVETILENSQSEQWRYVESKDNPADDGSRGVQSERWLNGPEFLLGSLDSDSEVIINEPESEESICLSAAGETRIPEELKIIRDWYTTVKVWAWILRWRRPADEMNLMRAAERAIIYQVQRLDFPEEIKALEKNGRISRKSPIFKMDAFLDKDGLIRAGGRLRRGPLPYELKHPIVLEGRNAVVRALIEHIHNKTHHQGRGITMGEVRNRGYFVLGLTRCVKSLIHACVICKKLRGKPAEQKMADLPPDRAAPSEPFRNVGCDGFGPFTVKNGRKEEKRYGLMFTCLACRAGHLEMAYELSTDSFLNAFRRFVCIRGPVDEMRCDHGTNFVGGEKELLKMGTQIRFNPPKASHAGGVWERMIGSARRILEGILMEHSTRLNDESLLTMFAETTAILNSRPLTTLLDHELEPLTPNHLIMMKSRTTITPLTLTTDPADLYATKRWKRVQYLSDLFWSRWKKEIVHIHHSRAKWNTPRKNIEVEDIVMMVDESTHRSHWKLARVVETKSSSDGLVRSATVMLPNRSKLDRPVQKLVFLIKS